LALVFKAQMIKNLLSNLSVALKMMGFKFDKHPFIECFSKSKLFLYASVTTATTIDNE